MHQSLARLQAVVLLIVALAGAGCNPFSGAIEGAKKSAERASTTADLKVLANLYFQHHDALNMGPAGWDEMMEYCQKTNTPTAPIERLREAGYTVKWGTSFRDLKDGASNTVMADKPGGPTLMFDGSVRTGN